MKQRDGFTFVEIILYIGMVSIFIVVLASFIGFFTQAKTKSSTIEEVNQQGMFLSEVIGQLIRDSDTITSPAKTQSACVLILGSTKFPTRSPIKVELLSGKIIVTESTGLPIQLSSDRVTISTLDFTNLSQATTMGNIGYRFTITYTNPSGKSEFNYTQTFYGSTTTR